MYPIFNLSLTSIWSAVSSTKNSRPWWALNPSSPNSYAILVSGYLVWQLWINHDMDVQYRRCTYGNGATLLSFIEWGNVMTVTWQPKFGSMGFRSLTNGAQELRYYRLLLFWFASTDQVVTNPLAELARRKFELTNPDSQDSASRKTWLSWRRWKLTGKTLKLGNFSHWRVCIRDKWRNHLN